MSSVHPCAARAGRRSGWPCPRQGEVKDSHSPVTGCAEAERRGVERLPRERRRRRGRRLAQRLRVDAPPPAIDLIADQPVPDMRHVHPDLMRPPGLEPASTSAAWSAKASTTATRVTACRPPWNTTACRCRSVRWRASCVVILRCRPARRSRPSCRAAADRPDRARRGRPPDTAARPRAPRTARRARDAPRRTSPRPEAPRCPCRSGARRPGRFSPPTPERSSPKWWRSALTSVPVGVPGAGCTTSPGGLSITARSSSSDDRQRDGLGSMPVSAASGTAIS
jgi:hypothetical protein